MDAVKTLNLTKKYGKMRGIEQINLTVTEGEFFGFIGPNGAGKSTTIRILLGLIKPTFGTASIYGLDITEDKEKILAQIGYLPSEAIFYSKMRVKDILKLSADLRKKDCKKMTENLCQRLQLNINRKVEELSFGNRKKVAIICALQHNPKLLILDEPTSGLDPVIRSEVLDMFQDFVNDKNNSILLSTHITSDLEHIADDVIFISHGKIIFNKPLKDIKEEYIMLELTHEEYENFKKDIIIRAKKNRLDYQVLIHKKDMIKSYEKYIKNITTLDDIMLLYIKGVSVCED